MTFLDKLHKVTSPQGLGLCIGLDPDPNRLPPAYPSDLRGISRFLHEIISVTEPFTAAYKVNSAFYEAWGAEGWSLMEKIARALPESSVRIGDAKRGDIGNTAKRYAQAFFENLPFDAITLNPYLGGDTLQPFLENPDKGAFVLALTTNPGSKELQHFADGNVKLYQEVMRLISEWAPHKNLGAVVGATHPDELKAIREEFPNVPLLIPGIGAQGGDAEVVASIAGGESKGPLLVNVSRGILFPKSELSFPENIVQACKEFRRALKISNNT